MNTYHIQIIKKVVKKVEADSYEEAIQNLNRADREDQLGYAFYEADPDFQLIDFYETEP